MIALSLMLLSSPLLLTAYPLTDDDWLCAEVFDTAQQVNTPSLTSISDAYHHLIVVTGIDVDFDTSNLSTALPPMWDSLLIPWPFDTTLLQVGAYRWSLSSFWYRESQGGLKIAGELAVDTVMLLPDSYGDGNAFDRGRFVRDVLGLLDPWIDFSRYDRDGDGVVDRGAIVVVLPRYRYEGYTAGHPDLGTSYTTVDGVVIGYHSGTTLSYGKNPHKLFSPEGIDNLKYAIAHEFGHHLGLPDKYDFGSGQNLNQCQVEHPHSKSSREGFYSLMVTLKPRPSPKLSPLSPWDRWLLQEKTGGSSPFAPVVDLTGENAFQNLVIPDLYAPGRVIYRIPIPVPAEFRVPEQAFLLATYFRDTTTFTGPMQGEGGLLVQLVWGDTAVTTAWSREKFPAADNILAVGLWDTTGVALPESFENPVWGYDLHDVGIAEWGYLPEGFGGFVADRVIDHNPEYSASSPYDLFPTTIPTHGLTRNALTEFTNPSSRGYAIAHYGWPTLGPTEHGYIRRDSFPGGVLQDNVIPVYWPDCGNTLSFPYHKEFNVARLLATHIVIRNIHADKQNRTVTLDLYTNFIQTDRDSALGHPQERRLVAGGPAWTDTLFLLYESGGVIYLTRAVNPPGDLGWIWEAAWPMDTLGHHPGLVRFTEWRWIPPDDGGPSSLTPFRRLCAAYAHETLLLRSCWWEDTANNTVVWRWIPRDTLAVFGGPVRFHTVAPSGVEHHHGVILVVGEKAELVWVRTGPEGEEVRESVDRWDSAAPVAVDVAALDSGQVAMAYTRGQEIWAAFRSGGTWRRELLSPAGETPLVDTLAGGYLFAWQEGDSIRVVWRDAGGKGGAPYGLTNGTLLALEGGVVLYRRSPLQPPVSGLFKRVYDGTSWGPEVYLMDPGNLTGFHIAPTGEGRIRMVAVQPTGLNRPGDPPYRVVDYAETGVGGAQGRDLRVLPALVIRRLPGGLGVQVGSGWPGVRYTLFDALGRRIVEVRTEGIRAFLPVPRAGTYVLQAVLPDGRKLREKVVFVK